MSSALAPRPPLGLTCPCRRRRGGNSGGRLASMRGRERKLTPAVGTQPRPTEPEPGRPRCATKSNAQSAPGPGPAAQSPARPPAQPAPLTREVLGLWSKPGSWLPLDGEGTGEGGGGPGAGRRSHPPPASHADLILLLLVHE